MPRSSSSYRDSPMSSYSMDSPAFSQELSDDEQFAYSAEYEARWGESAWGQWPADLAIGAGSGKQEIRLPWQRSGSIVSISSDEALEERKRMTQSIVPSRKSSSEMRRGSDTSLLAYALTRGRVSSLGSSRSKVHRIAAEQRRRSSNMSRGSNASTVYTDPEEAAQVRKLRSIDQLSRRFSEVVAVEETGESSSSEEEEIMHWTPSHRVQSAWSPDTVSDDSEDESEVQSLPSLPTPDVRPMSPAIFSNFPLPTVATQTSVVDSPRSPAGLSSLGVRPARLLDTPPPPVAPSHLVRQRQAPSFLRSDSAAAPGPSGPSKVLERPRQTRSVSSPLFVAAAYADQRRSKRLSHSKLKAIDTSASPSGSESSGAFAEAAPAIDLSQIRKQSIAEGVTDFDFLASEITVGREPMAPATSSRSTQRPTSLPLPIFKAHAHTHMLASMPTSPASPHTPRFNPMDSFLGKDGATPVAARPHHPESFFPLVSPNAHGRSPSSSGSPGSSASVSTPKLMNAPRVRPVSLQALVKAVGTAGDGLNIGNAPGLDGLDGSRQIATMPPAPPVYTPRLSPKSQYHPLPVLARTATEPVLPQRTRSPRKPVPVYDMLDLVPTPALQVQFGQPQVSLAPTRPTHARQQSSSSRSSHEHPTGRRCRRCEEKRLIREHRRGISDPHPRPTRPSSAQYTFPAPPQRPALPARETYSGVPQTLYGVPFRAAAPVPAPTLDSSPEFATRLRRKHVSIISGPTLVASSREMPAAIPAGPHAVHPDAALYHAEVRATQAAPPKPILRRAASAITLSHAHLEYPAEQAPSPPAATSRLSGSAWIKQLRTASSASRRAPTPMYTDSQSSGSDRTLVGTPPRSVSKLSDDDKAYLQHRVHHVRL